MLPNIKLFLAFCFAISFSLFIASRYYMRYSVGVKQKAILNDQDPRNYTDLWNAFTSAKNIWMRTVATTKNNGSQSDLESVNRRYILLRRSLEKSMKITDSERRNKLEQLSDFIYRKLNQLQNPKDCSNAKLLICGIEIKCGFGCYTHTIVNCILKAFDSERVLIFKPNNCHYGRECMQQIFLPTTNCDYDGDIHDVPFIQGSSDNRRVVRIRKGHTPYLPWQIPTELADPLLHIHGDPYVWWLGQFVAYVLRPQPWFQKKIDQTKEEMNFDSPIAGIQVRRGDKLGKISQYYSIEQYMMFVDLWFDQLELDQPDIQRRLYIATEDYTVLDELKEKYPRYILIMNKYLHKTVEKDERYSTEGLETVAVDIYFLSMCDYVVCTLSSNVCRAAYELMMNLRSDASIRIQSLDIPYKFKLIWQQNWTAVMNHEPIDEDEEIELRIGDKISVKLEGHEQYNEGFHPGKNLRTKKSGIFPTNKARPDILLHSFSLLKQNP